MLNPPLLWLLYHRSWALSELGEGCLALVHRTNTQMGTHTNKVWSPCRPALGASSPCSITVEVQHPSERMWLPADTQFAMHRYFYRNSALCHPAQFSLILFCIVQIHSASFTNCPRTWVLDTQGFRSHQRTQVNMLKKVLLFPLSNTNLKINGSNKVGFLGFLLFFFFSFFPHYFPAAEHNKCQDMQYPLSWPWNHKRP